MLLRLEQSTANRAARADSGRGVGASRLAACLLACLLPLLLGACGGGSTASIPVPATTLTLTGIDPLTQVSGHRFGFAPPRTSGELDYNSSIATRANGVTMTFTSTVSGTTSYDIGCTGTFAIYNSSNKPVLPDATMDWSANATWDPITQLTQGALPQEVCVDYFTTATATETTKNTTLYFDTVPVQGLLQDTLGVDPTTTVYTQFPSFNVGINNLLLTPTANVDPGPNADDANYRDYFFYPSETATIYYRTDGGNPITATKAALIGAASSSSIAVTDAASFFGTMLYSSSNRIVNIITVDDVGNEGPMQSITIPMDLMATTPSAGHYKADTDVQLDPPAGDFESQGLSIAYLRICRYSTAGGYECNNPSNAWSNAAPAFAASAEVDATTGDYFYSFGNSSPTDNEVISLPSTNGITFVYDVKILNDSTLDDGSATDSVSQALFVLDRDVPQLLVYADPDTSSATTLTAAATAFDEGYFVLEESDIHDYLQDRDILTACTLTVPDTCQAPTAPTLTLPASAYTLPSDGNPVAVEVTATDAAGNATTGVRYMPIGRGILKGPSTGIGASANLGQAIVSGHFNDSGLADGTDAADYAVSDPSKGGGVVYLFYDGFPTELSLDSTPLTTVDASAPLVVEIDNDGDGVADVTITADLTARAYVIDPLVVTPTELATAFNQVVLNAVYTGTFAEPPVRMAAVDTDGVVSTKEVVRLTTNDGIIDTCVRFIAGALTTQLGYAAGTWSCLYDERLEGAAAGDQFGHGLAVGDFDNDGDADLAVGAPKAGGVGAVYIFQADSTSATVPFTGAGAEPAAALSTAAVDFTITGAAANDDFGWAIGAGDLNTAGADADATDDLLVGAPGITDAKGADTGGAYLFRGPFAGNRVAGGADVTVDNPEVNDGSVTVTTSERFGHAVLVAELNTGSSFPANEFAIGAPGVEFIQDTSPIGYSGRAWLFSFASIGTGINANYGASSTVDAKFGWALGYAHRVYADKCTSSNRCMAIGAPGEQDASGNVIGAAYFGTMTQLSLVSSGTGSTAYRVLGSSPGQRMGTGFARGDLNGDGYSDLLIGQGGALTSGGTTTLNYGGFSILEGAATGPSTGTPLTVTKQFAAWDVEESTGGKLQTRLGGPMLMEAGDPLTPSTISHILVGAPGGQKRFPAASPSEPNAPGRVHVITPAALGY